MVLVEMKPDRNFNRLVGTDLFAQFHSEKNNFNLAAPTRIDAIWATLVILWTHLTKPQYPS
jgi:hypothetical protein